MEFVTIETLVIQYQKFTEKSKREQNLVRLLDEFEEAMARVLTILDEGGVQRLLSKDSDQAVSSLDLDEFKTTLQALVDQGLALAFDSTNDALRFIIALAFTRGNQRAR